MDIVSFDVLLRGRGGDVPPSAATIEQLRAPPEHIERCNRWLSAQGITCHTTDFGLACESPVELFERVFGVSLERRATGGGRPSFQLTQDPQVPEEIAPLVDQITLAPPPTYF